MTGELPGLLHLSTRAWGCPKLDPLPPLRRTGRNYYHNIVTNVTQWSHPMEDYYRGIVFMNKEGTRLLEEKAMTVRPADSFWRPQGRGITEGASGPAEAAHAGRGAGDVSVPWDRPSG